MMCRYLLKVSNHTKRNTFENIYLYFLLGGSEELQLPGKSGSFRRSESFGSQNESFSRDVTRKMISQQF